MYENHRTIIICTRPSFVGQKRIGNSDLDIGGTEQDIDGEKGTIKENDIALLHFWTLNAENNGIETEHRGSKWYDDIEKCRFVERANQNKDAINTGGIHGIGL